MSLKEKFIGQFKNTDSLEKLEALRLDFLGKKGKISTELRELGKLPPEERKSRGQEINKLRDFVFAELTRKKEEFEAIAINARLETEIVDVTLPARQSNLGSIHPISYVTDEVVRIFGKMGFTAVDGPEIEDDYHNFTALNIDENHPARQMHDTFYFGDVKTLLRTHTSSVQIRAMEEGKPPFAIIAPGKTYRSDSDATHTPMFHQIEALYVAEKASMGQLKYVIKKFLDEFFGENIDLRFRSSFFPFTEPSAEVDIGCKMSPNKIDLKGSGDYLEIMGCGMVHPNVLKAAGIDPTKYKGFALGMGIERIAMLKYGMRDLRQFFGANKNWLETYNFKAWQ